MAASGLLSRAAGFFRRPPKPPMPVEPSPGEWAELRPRAGVPLVDVVVPVYAGRVETFRTLQRVLASSGRTPFETVVIDDATPDPAIAAKLRELAARGLITLLVNDRNRGFVATVNRGMALHPERDVVLLNADTEVFGDWVDRLMTATAGAERIGTATPWSNAATILSYPRGFISNQLLLEIGPAGLDRLASRLAPTEIDIPTGVGFCLYIRRPCLAEVGLFDEVNFGRGYGEENDFCRRAASLGWRHIAATNVYVHHYEGRSFGAEKARRVDAAIATLERMYPGYKALINEFIRRDPLAASRSDFDAARVRAAAGKNFLRLGGGRHGSSPGEGEIWLVISPWWHRGRFRLACDRVPETPNLPVLSAAMPVGMVAGILRSLAVERLVVGRRAPRRLVRLVAAAAASAGIEVCDHRRAG